MPENGPFPASSGPVGNPLEPAPPATAELQGPCQVTPEMRRADRRNERRRRRRHRLTLLWGRTLYRPWQRLLHRFDLHHCRKMLPLEPRWHHVKCDWCGLHGRILIISPQMTLEAPDGE